MVGNNKIEQLIWSKMDDKYACCARDSLTDNQNIINNKYNNE